MVAVILRWGMAVRNCRPFNPFLIASVKKLSHSFMAPKSMSSEVENVEIKGKEKNNTDKLNLSGQFVQQLISY